MRTYDQEIMNSCMFPYDDIEKYKHYECDNLMIAMGYNTYNFYNRNIYNAIKKYKNNEY